MLKVKSVISCTLEHRVTPFVCEVYMD